MTVSEAIPEFERILADWTTRSGQAVTWCMESRLDCALSSTARSYKVSWAVLSSVEEDLILFTSVQVPEVIISFSF